MRITNQKQLAALLEDSRKKLGLSQENLGGKVGVMRKTVNKLENDPGSSQIDSLFLTLSALGLDMHITKKEDVCNHISESLNTTSELKSKRIIKGW